MYVHVLIGPWATWGYKGCGMGPGMRGFAAFLHNNFTTATLQWPHVFRGGSSHGCRLSADAHGPVSGEPCLGVGARPPGQAIMNARYVLAGLLSLFLFGYLLYALFKAQKF